LYGTENGQYSSEEENNSLPILEDNPLYGGTLVIPSNISTIPSSGSIQTPERPVSFALAIERTERQRKKYLKSLTDKELMDIVDLRFMPSPTPKHLSKAIWKEAQLDPVRVALAINSKLLRITSQILKMFKFVYDYDTLPKLELVNEKGGDLSPNTLLHRTNLIDDNDDAYTSYMETINNTPIHWPLLSDATIQKMPDYSLLDYIEILLFAYSREGKSEQYFLSDLAKTLGVDAMTHRQVIKHVLNIINNSWIEEYEDVKYATYTISNALTVKQLNELYNIVRGCVNVNTNGKLLHRTKEGYLNYLYGNSGIKLRIR
jgi:hypothetical protein